MHKLISHISAPRHKDYQGFSLVEIVIVVFILGILGSITLPRIQTLANDTKIDSVKAKLNAAAATCLQNIRLGKESDERIDQNILSDQLLESEDYRISSDMNSCASLMVQAVDDNNTYFFPMGFTISKGRLTKFAFPLSQDNERACKSWAGSNCKAGEALLDLIAHNKAVEEAKTKCTDDFYIWLSGNPPVVPAGDGKRNRWNPKADSDCKRIPPANKTETCTTQGCNLETWAFEGTIVAGEEGYKEALERKYGKICSQKLEAKLLEKYTGGPVTILECGANRVMWFHKGIDVKTQEEMNRLICIDKQTEHEDNRTTGETTIPVCGDKIFYYCLGEDKKTEPLMKSCISENAEASCQNEINEKIAEGYEGEFTPEPGGPGVCSVVTWICKGKQFGTEQSYKEDCGSCKPDPPNFCEREQFWRHPSCSKWAACEGLI